MIPFRLYIVTPVLFLILSSSAHGGQKAFGPDSLKHIEKTYAGEPFLLVLWSSDCAPCFKELEMLGRMEKESFEMNLVLVATDPPGNRDKLDKILEKYGLAKAESWAFSNHAIEKLRYTIDPEWYGEIPRSYLYNADLERRAVSGQLKPEEVRKLFR